ncbi:hypothetical protein BBJ28_00026155, partial [Nothophytophthora sp. Chile5]
MEEEDTASPAGDVSTPPPSRDMPASALIPEAAVSEPLPPHSDEPEKPCNGAADTNGTANGDSESGDTVDSDKGPSPLKTNPKPRPRAPPRRLRSGSGSGSNTSSSGVRRESGAPRAASANMGIVVGTMRRRHRANIRQNSLSDEEAEDVVAAVAAAVAAPRSVGLAPRRSKRQASLRNMASLVRSHLRNAKSLQQPPDTANSVDGADSGTKPTLERSNSSFAGVAQQVVTTRRAARGFLSMWTKDSTETMHVYRGLHMEKKKLDLVSVAAEYKAIKRRQFYQELVVYFVFLTLLFSLLSWLPVEDSFHQNDVVGALTCREEGVCELKTFSDIYDFAGTLRETVCDRQDVTAQWVRVGGVGFRQVRVKEHRCRVYDGWMAPCYPFYSEDVEQKDPLQGEPESGRVY